MKSLFDLASFILFAGLAILWLQRSAAPERDATPLWRYGAAALGCAGGDVLGNNGYGLVSGVVLTATTVFVIVGLKPFARASGH